MMDFKDRPDILTNVVNSDNCPTCQRHKGSNARECDKCLEYLNAARMVIDFGYRQTVETVQAGAIVALHNWLDITKLDLAGIYLLQKKLEALSGDVAAIYTSLK